MEQKGPGDRNFIDIEEAFGQDAGNAAAPNAAGGGYTGTPVAGWEVWDETREQRFRDWWTPQRLADVQNGLYDADPYETDAPADLDIRPEKESDENG